MAECGCGRSPTGKCVGWHGLSEQQQKHSNIAFLVMMTRHHSIQRQYHSKTSEGWELL